MREFTAALAIAAALIATDARAEAWTVQDENGQWHNTEHHPDNAPKPQPPERVAGEKPKDRQTLKADKRDREPEAMKTAPGYYCRLNGEVVNFRNAPGLPPKKVTRACPSYAHKVAKDGGVPGLFGPHEGGE